MAFGKTKKESKWHFRFLSTIALCMLIMAFIATIFSLKGASTIGFLGAYILSLAAMAYVDSWRNREEEA